MKISGFSMARNAARLYYPLAESVASALPLVDEFVVALGQGDADDDSRAQLLALNSPKLRIIDTVWDLEAYPRGTVHAQQTTLAMRACTGDWLLYLQADEVLHEQDHPAIRSACQQWLDRPEVEGLLFDYLHFWGDYQHLADTHGWYPHEVRVVRNRPDIYSWESAQSFRRIPAFSGNYRQQEGTHKLQVKRAGARIFHYGWVRPPHLMREKTRAINTNHHGASHAEALYQQQPVFQYGPLRRRGIYKGTQPAVMQPWVERLNWQDQLDYTGLTFPDRVKPFKHERLKYRVLTWIERNLLGGRRLGEFHNYILLKD